MMFWDWEKLGRVFVPDKSVRSEWMQEYAQAPNSLLLEDRIRVFFSTRESRNDQGQYISYVAYVDVDINEPTKVIGVSDRPVLPLGESGEFDEFGTYPFSPIQLKDRVLAAYGGWTRCDSVPFDVSIGMAQASSIHTDFEKQGNGPILTRSLTEPFIISSPKLRIFERRFFLFYIAGETWKPGDRVEPVYSIRLATSDDGANWVKLEEKIIPKVLGEDEAQASPDVFHLNDRYHMFFSYRNGIDYKNPLHGYRMGYAYSNDLMNWKRDDSLFNLTKSEYGWDSRDISYPNVLRVNNLLYCFYNGNNVGREGFGVARMKIK